MAKRKIARSSSDGAEVVCPFCGALDEVTVDLGGGQQQTYVEDCSTCCRPRIVHVEPDASGDVRVWVERGD